MNFLFWMNAVFFRVCDYMGHKRRIPISGIRNCNLLNEFRLFNICLVKKSMVFCIVNVYKKHAFWLTSLVLRIPFLELHGIFNSRSHQQVEKPSFQLEIWILLLDLFVNNDHDPCKISCAIKPGPGELYLFAHVVCITTYNLTLCANFSVVDSFLLFCMVKFHHTCMLISVGFDHEWHTGIHY